MNMGSFPKGGRRSIDPITAEVLRYQMLAIAKQVDVNITKTAYSPLIYEYKDYAVGLVDHRGRLIAQGGGSAPVFVANALGVAVQDGLLVLGEDAIEAGDIILTNHSGTLGQHLNNVVAYMPIFTGGPEPRIFAYMACVVHWLDIGGTAVGSCTAPHATDIFQEGVQFRHMKLWSRGKADKGAYATIEANTRMPLELMGDIEAQVAGCLYGRDLFRTMLDKYGEDEVRQAIDIMWEASEAAARAVVSSIPDGTYRAESLLDCDPAKPGVPIPIRVAVTVAGNTLNVDFAGSAPQAVGPINSGKEGGSVAAARIAFKYLVSREHSANFGTFAPLSVSIPDGTFLSAHAQAPMGGYSSALPTVIDTILKAMVPVLPEQLAGGHHGAMEGVRISGVHPETGQLFLHIDTCLGGWGALSGTDGPGAYKTMVHGDTLEVPIESVERAYPLRVEHYEIRPDSGGPGEYRGSNGVEKVFLALAPCELTLLLDRTACPPWGVMGGQDGRPTIASIERGPQRIAEAVTQDVVRLAAGDRLRMKTAGGGGYGNPALRKRDLVERDLAGGYISRSAAATDYGVVPEGR